MTQSGYDTTKTIEQVTREQYAQLLAGAQGRTVNEETAYGLEVKTACRFTLSGGGPGSDIVFLLDRDLESGGEVAEGFFSYYEFGGSHVIPFGARDGQELFDALLSSAEEQDDEPDEDDGDELDEAERVEIRRQLEAGEITLDPIPYEEENR